jgi:hypothetical protein
VLCLEAGIYILDWSQFSSYDSLDRAERREKEFTTFIDEDFGFFIEAVKAERQKSIAGFGRREICYG